jgi:4a-hydroxytetrahydrobiopterin dehydratase
VAEVLSDEAIAAALAGLGWEHRGPELVKVHKGAGFRGALDYVNRVGQLAEGVNHHPDIDIRWDTVTLRLSTHSAGGITQADVDLARAIEALK